MVERTMYTVGGTVQAGSGVYIERNADVELLDLCRAAIFAYILAPRQIGKSSLMIRTAQQLGDEGIQAVIVDLTQLGVSVTAEAWYLGLLAMIEEQLLLETDVVTWWHDRAHLGFAQRLTLFFQQVLLHEVSAPVVIFVDEIDSTLSLDFTDDFFAAVRSLYDARARIPALRRLSFVLIGVATPGDLIRDPKRTPFNIGQRVELSDFTLEEALPFADGLGLPPDDARQVLAWVLKWTRGHPYLTQRICRVITDEGQPNWSEAEVDRIVDSTFFGAKSEQDNNLQFVRDMLTKRAPDLSAVLTAYRDIRRGRRPVPDEEQSLVKTHLKLSGAVRREETALVVRNPIYAHVFDDRWVREHLPLTWKRYRRTVAVIALLSAISLVLGFLTVYANARANEARVAQAVAQSQALAFRAQTVSDPELSLLLAIEAAKIDQNQQVQDVLRQAIQASSVRVRLSGHEGPVTSAMWSPDGERIVTASDDGTARVWDAANSMEVQVLRGHDSWLLSATWSLDGERIVTTSDDGTARVWDAASGTELHRLEIQMGALFSATWSPDGERIVTASDDGTARVWEVSSGTEVQVLRGHDSWLLSATWRPDGERIVTTSADGTARVWEVSSGTEVQVLRGHEASVFSVTWSPNGRRIVTVSTDGTARVWEVSSGTVLQVLRSVSSATWSPDGRRIVTASDDGTARVWEVSSGTEVQVLRGHEDSVFSATWSPDGRRIVTASDDGTARVWDAASGTVLQVLRTYQDWANSTPWGQTEVLSDQESRLLGVAWSPDGEWIVTTSTDGTVQVWEATSGELQVLHGHEEWVNSAMWSPDGERIVTASDDGTARVWDAANGMEVQVLRGHGYPVNSAAWSPDGEWIVTTSADGTAQVWEVSSGTELHGLEIQMGALFSAMWSPDGERIVTASEDGTAQVWEASSGTEVQVLRGHDNWVLSATWSPDGEWIVTASLDGTARVWEASSGTEVQVLRGHEASVLSATWSPDGERIVTASGDGTARVWEAANGMEVYVLHGHQDSVNSATWSPDGQRIVTASGDGTARVWEAANGMEVQVLRGHQKAVWSTTWSPDGQQIATTSLDGTVRVYYANFADVFKLAESRVTRQLTPEERQLYLGEIVPTALPTLSTTPSTTVTATP